MVTNAGTQNQTKRTKANMPQHSSIQCGSPTIFKRWEYHGISIQNWDPGKSKQKLP